MEIRVVVTSSPVARSASCGGRRRPSRPSASSRSASETCSAPRNVRTPIRAAAERRAAAAPTSLSPRYATCTASSLSSPKCRHQASSQAWRRCGLGRGIARTRSSHESPRAANPSAVEIVSNVTPGGADDAHVNKDSPTRRSLSLHIGEKSLHVLLVAQDATCWSLLAPGEVGEHLGPDDPPVDPEKAQKPRESPVERRRLAVGGHLRARPWSRACVSSPARCTSSGEASMNTIVSAASSHSVGVVPCPPGCRRRSRTRALALGAGSPATRDRAWRPSPASSRAGRDGSTGTSRSRGELPAEPGLARARRTEECDALHETRMELVRSRGQGLTARGTWVYAIYGERDIGGSYARLGGIRGPFACGPTDAVASTVWPDGSTRGARRRSAGRRRSGCRSSCSPSPSSPRLLAAVVVSSLVAAVWIFTVRSAFRAVPFTLGAAVPAAVGTVTGLVVVSALNFWLPLPGARAHAVRRSR